MEQKEASTNNNEKIIKSGLMLLPPVKDVCQECAVKHGTEEPHNALSIYYQYSFHAKYGKWPTWSDAIAHCSDDLKEAWVKELKKIGQWEDE